MPPAAGSLASVKAKALAPVAAAVSMTREVKGGVMSISVSGEAPVGVAAAAETGGQQRGRFRIHAREIERTETGEIGRAEATREEGRGGRRVETREIGGAG